MLGLSCRRLVSGKSVRSLPPAFNSNLVKPFTLSPTSHFAASTKCLATSLSTSHQLRYGSSSSSKNNSNGTATASARSQPLRKKRKGSQEDVASAAAVSGTTTGKGTRTSSKGKSSELEDAEGGKQTRQRRSLLNALPSVPSTDYMTTKDIALSTFFALHRPVSVTYPVPALYDSTKFSKIFEESDAKQQYSLQRETQKAQRRALFDVEGGTEASPYPEHAATGAPASEQIEVIEDGTGNRDSASIQVPNDVFVTDTYVPFQPPPVPVAASEQEQTEEQGRQQHGQWQQTQEALLQGVSVSSNPASASKPLQIVLDNVEQMAQMFFPSEPFRTGESRNRVEKRYITLVQSMLPDGSIHLTPVAPDGPEQAALQRTQSGLSPYLGRKEILRRGILQALSTKRRRILKMKKHKLKKLRRRLRNEQRKLNRL